MQIKIKCLLLLRWGNLASQEPQHFRNAILR
jgi:hypothetical protein